MLYSFPDINVNIPITDFVDCIPQKIYLNYYFSNFSILFILNL